MSIRRVVLESPYAAPTDEAREANIQYARDCMADSLNRGEAPFLGHLLYTQVWEDRVPELRRKGIDAHCEWIAVCDAVVLYTDKGITNGMRDAMTVAMRLGRPFEMRTLAEAPAALVAARDKHRELIAESVEGGFPPSSGEHA